MEDIANELVAYMDFLGYKTTLDIGQNGGFIFHERDFSDMGLPYQSQRGIHKELREQLSEISQKLKNPKSHLTPLRAKLEKFKKDALHTAFDPSTFKNGSSITKRPDRKTLDQFKTFLEDYYDKDDASSTGTSQGSSVDDITNQMGRIDLSPAGASVEEQRQLAMKRPFIEEKVADFSDVFHKEQDAPKRLFEGVEATGMGEHLQYGEKVYNAKLTNVQATEIRTKYFTTDATIPSLARDYKVSVGTVGAVLKRKTWKHLPQVEGESDEIFNQPNTQEQRIIKLAKKHGVEPVRNKIGRLALPPALIKQLREERKAEKEMKA
jgi:hypothetical protein